MAVGSETVRVGLDVSSVVANANAARSGVDNLRNSLKALSGVSLSSVATQENRITSAARATTDQLNKQLAVQAKIASFSAKRTRDIALGESRLAKMTADATRGVEGEAAGPGMTGMLSAMGGAAAAAAVVLAVVAKISKAAYDVLEAGTKLAVAETSRKEATLASFKAISGSSKVAAVDYGRMINLSKNLGQGPEQTASQMRKLMSEGFKGPDVTKIIASSADIAAARGEGAASKYQRVIEAAQNKGKIDKSTINQLAKMGIATGDVYNELAKRMHKTRSEVEAIAAGGKKANGASIDAATGIAAIASAAEKRYGGAAGREAMNSIAGLKNRLAITFNELFTGMDSTPIKNALRSAIKVLEGPAGAQLKTAFSTLFSSIGHALGDAFAGKEGQQRLTGVVVAASKLILGLAKIITAVAPVITGAMGAIAKDFNKADLGQPSWIGTVQKMQVALHSLVSGDMVGAGIALGRVAINIESALGLVSPAKAAAASKALDVIERMKQIKDGIAGAAAAGKPAAAAPTAATSAMAATVDAVSGIDVQGTSAIGTNMTAGVVSGIQSGQAGIVSAMTTACNASVSAANSSLQIHSPSKVFDTIGQRTAEGMAGGMTRGAGGVAAAASGLGDTAASSGGSGLMSGRSSNTTQYVAMNYSGAALQFNGGGMGTPEETAAHTAAAEEASLKAFQRHFSQTMRELQEA